MLSRSTASELRASLVSYRAFRTEATCRGDQGHSGRPGMGARAIAGNCSRIALFSNCAGARFALSYEQGRFQ